MEVIEVASAAVCLYKSVHEESEVESEHEELKNTPPENEPVSMENLEEEGALDLNQPRRGQLREGMVMEVRPEGLVVNIGSKLDGFVPSMDLEDLPEDDREFSVGQTVPVVVLHSRDHDGNVKLSISQARQQEDWLKAEKLKESEEVYETKVLESNRGGLTVEFGRLRGFVPMSQLIGFSRIHQASERFRRLNAMVDKSIMLKVIEVNRQRRRLILSQRAASKEWRAVRRQRLLEELESGQIRTGRISQITNFGLFVNLGGLDGLVHVSELSWGRIENPADVYRIGQRIKIKVLNVDRERQRIALSIKSLTPDPWDSVPERYTIGDLIEGRVNQIADFGVFVELEPGVEGLLHNSELATPEQREELEVGSRELMKIIRIEPDRRRIGLSVRQVRREEWEQWAAEMETARVEAEAAKAAEEAARVEAKAARAAEKAARAEAKAAKAAEKAARAEAEAAKTAEEATVEMEPAAAPVAAECVEAVEEAETVEAEGAAAPVEEAEAVEAENAASPVEEAEIVEAEGAAAPVEEAETVKAEDAAAPVEEAETVEAEGAAAPVEEAETVEAEDAAVPVEEAEIVEAEDAAAPVEEAETVEAEDAAVPVEEAEIVEAEGAAAPVEEAEIVEDEPTAAPVTAECVEAVEEAETVEAEGTEAPVAAEVVEAEGAAPPVTAECVEAVEEAETVEAEGAAAPVAAEAVEAEGTETVEEVETIEAEGAESPVAAEAVEAEGTETVEEVETVEAEGAATPVAAECVEAVEEVEIVEETAVEAEPAAAPVEEAEIVEEAAVEAEGAAAPVEETAED